MVGAGLRASPPRRPQDAPSLTPLPNPLPKPQKTTKTKTTQSISCVGIIVYRGLYFGMYDSIKPVLLVGSLADNFLAAFMLGWGITIGAGLASYPIDTVRRRMMMTSGQAVKYSSSLDCFQQVVAKEGVKSLFKGAGANILRAVAGAGGEFGGRRDGASKGLAGPPKRARSPALDDPLPSITHNHNNHNNITVLAGYDQVQLILFGKKYGSGEG